MARKGYGRNSTLVNTTTHADDGTSPVGSNEWNENPKTDGIFGLTKSTQAISSNDIDVTDSYVEVTNTGDIYTLSAVTTSLPSSNYPSDSTSSISEGDLIYVVKAASLGSGVVNLKHQNGGAGAGKITTLTAGSKALSATVPTILMARIIGSVLEWVEYGGGAVADSSITSTKIANDTILNEDINSSANIALSKLASDPLARAGHTGTQAASTISDFDTEVANNTAVTANTAKISYSTAASNAVAANTAKTGITSGQASAITANTGLLAATAGTVTASKALIVDASKDLTGINNLTVAGDLTVNGTNTIINSTTLTVDDKNIEMGSVASPSDTTADGGGITLKGATDKTILWDNANDNFTSSEHVNIASGKSFKVNNTALKDVTETLTGKSIVASQLTGTIADSRMPDLTGEVTTVAGAVATTIIDNVIDEANLKVNNSPTDGYVLKALASASGGLTWGTGGGGAHTEQDFTVQSAHAADPSSSVATLYVKTIDTNNEGLFIKMKKNGSIIYVQVG